MRFSIGIKAVIVIILGFLFFGIITILIQYYSAVNLSRLHSDEELTKVSETTTLMIRMAMISGSQNILKKAIEEANKIPGINSLDIHSAPKLKKNTRAQKNRLETEVENAFITVRPSYDQIEGEDSRFVRILKPIAATDECLECHQDFEEGETLAVLDLTITDNKSNQFIEDVVINTAIILAVLTMVTAFLAWLFFYKNIILPIRSMVDILKNITRQKAVTSKKLPVVSKDEFGQMAKLFNQFTSQLTNIIRKGEEDARKIKELMDSNQKMTVFKKVVEEDDSVEEIYQRLQEVFENEVGFSNFVVYNEGKDSNSLEPIFSTVGPTSQIHCDEAILTESPLCRCHKTGNKIDSFEFSHLCRQFLPDVFQNHVCIPMAVHGRTRGIIQFLFRNESPCTPKEMEKKVQLAKKYLKEALPVIESKKLMQTLEESATQDSLTGLYNRRFLQDYMDSVVSGIIRRGKVIGLIMCDLDYFKQINDKYGHVAGDTVLKECADTLRHCVRESDIVVRFGGEEFLVLLLDIQENDSMEIAEKIRSEMEANKIKISDGIIQRTISLGVSEFPVDTDSFWQSIKYADDALYKAKELGRNKAVRFTEEMWSEPSK